MKPLTNFLRHLSTQHPDVTAGLGYALLTILFYAPLLLGLRTFPDGDFTHHFLPFSLFQQQALLAGQLPVWNPYTYSGHPFLADTQAAVFYPISNLVLGVTLPWTAPGVRLYFLQIEAALHVALAGFFVYLLVRDLTRNRGAAFLAGGCFAFSGYLTSYPPLQLAVLRTAVWLPLILWLLWQAFQAPQRWRWWLGAALAYTCALLAGHPQTFLHISYTVLAWILCLFVQMRRSARTIQSRAYIVGAVAFFALAVALSAAQLWPSLEFAQLSVRANVDYAFVSGGFPLQDTWQMLLPGVLTQYSPLYIGVVGVGLALLAICVRILGSGRQPELADPASFLIQRLSLVPFFACLTIVALLLSYGSHSFLYPLFYRFAPGWQLFRGQERAAFLVVLGLSVLAGYGAALLAELPLRVRRRLAILISIVMAAGIYAFGLIWQFLGHSAIGNGTYLIIALVTFLFALVLVVILHLEGWHTRRMGLLIGLVVGNLFWANFTLNLDALGPTRKTILAPEMVAVQQAVQSSNTDALNLPGRVYNEFRVYEDYGMRQQLEDVWGSSPLRLARYAALFDQFPLDRLWRLTGVKHVLTWRRELFGPSDVLAQFPQTKDTTYLHHLKEANPRAWVATALQSASDQATVALLADHTFDLENKAVLPPGLFNDSLIMPVGHNQITLQRLATNRIHVNVDSEKGGLLVVSENWMPGWAVARAECGVPSVNCPRSPIPALSTFSVYRTDLSFIGLPIPAGQTHFELVYWPDSVRYGLWLSGATLGLLTLACLWHWVQQRKGSKF
ncbi:hypothetical protein BH10CHL1_BH10CHL1_21530 [soil metagenome]